MVSCFAETEFVIIPMGDFPSLPLLLMSEKQAQLFYFHELVFYDRIPIPIQVCSPLEMAEQAAGEHTKLHLCLRGIRLHEQNYPLPPHTITVTAADGWS